MARQTVQQRNAPLPPADSSTSSSLQELRGRIQFVRGGTRSALGLSKVYLSVQDMSAFRIEAGSHVAVFSSSEQDGQQTQQQQRRQLLLCGIAWPMDKIKRHGVGLSSMWEHHLKQQRVEIVNVLPFQQVQGTLVAQQEANTVMLHVVSRASRLPSEKERVLLSRYVAAMLDGVLLHAQALLSLSVHGTNTVFKVVRVNHEANINGGDDDVATNDEIVVYRMTRQTALVIDWEKRDEDQPIEDLLTALKLSPRPTEAEPDETQSTPATHQPLRGFASVGGLKAEIETIRQIIEQPLVNPEMFRKFGLPPPKGLLMFGPPGTGKTLVNKKMPHARTADCLLFVCRY